MTVLILVRRYLFFLHSNYISDIEKFMLSKGPNFSVKSKLIEYSDVFSTF